MNLFSNEFYSGGGGSIPEGDYALEFILKMHQAVKRDTGQAVGKARLGVLVRLHPVDAETGERTGETLEKFYSMGGKAHESFMPGEDGKSLVPVAGARFNTLYGQSNWNELRKSLVNCAPEIVTDLPENDLTALDGTWAHMNNVPEPEERKSFKSKTADVDDEGDDAGPKGNGMVLVCAEIKAKPWEGGGGIPEGDVVKEEKPKAAAKPVAKAAAKPTAVAKPGPKPVAKPAAKPAATSSGDDDVMALAVSLISAQLESNLSGMSRLKLRSEVFKAAGKDNQNAVIAAAFKDDETLLSVLGPLGFTIKGSEIVAE